MFAMMMDKGKVVRIFLLDDSLATEGFDITDAVKRPDILLNAAEDHLKYLQDEIRGEHN